MVFLLSTTKKHFIRLEGCYKPSFKDHPYTLREPDTNYMIQVISKEPLTRPWGNPEMTQRKSVILPKPKIYTTYLLNLMIIKTNKIHKSLVLSPRIAMFT